MKTIPFQPKSIMFIAPVPPPLTGQAIACKVLYNHLIEQGHKVELVNLSKSSFVSGINSYSRVIEILYILKQIYINRNSVELVYFTPAESIAGNLKDLLVYFLLIKKMSFTYIHLHGGAGMKEIFSSKHFILKKLNTFFIRKMKGVIVLGNRLGQIYDGMIEPEKIFVVKNFSLPDYFITSDRLKKKYKELKILRILFLSNLLPGKGYNELLTALLRLPAHVRRYLQVDFAGGFEDDIAKNEFIKIIANYPEFHYHGVVSGEQKKELLLNAHLFCLPTYYPYEGQPISILEAYASGCAVMTTDHSGIFDIFTPELNGVQVIPKNADDIADKLKIIFEQKLILKKYGVINARFARNNFKVKQHLSVINEVFDIGN